MLSELLEKGGCEPFFSKLVKNQFNQMDTRIAEKDARIAEIVAEKDTRICEIVAEKDALVAVKDELVTKLTAEKDTRIAEIVAEKDKRLAEKDALVNKTDTLTAEKSTRIDEKDARIDELVAENKERMVTFMRELSRFKLVYEWRGTLDWYLRVLHPSKPKTPSGSLWKDLVTTDLADKNSSVIEKVLADLQPYFPVSAQAMDRIRNSFIGVYGEANSVMHRYPAIEQEKGICCGGVDPENMVNAAASVLALQRFGNRLGIPIPLELDSVAVLNPSLDSVHGKCVGGDYQIH